MGDSGEKFESGKGDLLKPLPVRKVRLRVNKYLAAPGKAVKPHYFTEKQKKFMEVYAESLDFQKALKESGLTKNMVDKNDYLQQEIKLIEEAYLIQHRTNLAIGHHQRLFKKFERDYDRSENAKFKASMAGVLAKMSEAAMKANGDFADKEQVDTTNGIKVIMNFGNVPPPESVTVDTHVEPA